MPRICPLFSGSTGNCIYISGSDGALLIDAGVSCKAIIEALNDRALDVANIRAILVTHSHSDHTQSIRALSGKLGIPVYATADTLTALENQNKINPKSPEIEVDGEFCEAGMKITPFETSHDCLGSVGYSFVLPDHTKISVCTDLGIMTDEVRKSITGSNAVLIESNHDVNMLKNGPYPPELKARILSDKGHLSNVACATELPALLKSGTTRFILGHLSLNNNLPEIAKSCSESVLISDGALNGRDYLLSVAPESGGEVMYL